MIPLTHIESATNDFSKEYTVYSSDEGFNFYRAKLEHYDKENHSSKRHNTVIIMRYPVGNNYYKEEEFLTEIEMLMNIKHPNIVALLGFCIEHSEMILVIENFSNKLLGQYFRYDNDRRTLTWERRLKICIGVGHALRYIHYEMEDQKMIINRDINCYNIGLDENQEAKIVHFWWSVFVPPNQEDKALQVKRRFGRGYYKDPQYNKTGKIKRETDVYSFGVVLLELLCGRLGSNQIYKNESNKGLVAFARQSFSTGKLKDMIDPLIKDEIGENNFVLNRGPNRDSLDTFIEIAHLCVAETQDERPTMKVVVNELEKALFLQVSHRSNFKLSMRRCHLCVESQKYKKCRMLDDIRFKLI
ncbi:putative protein kinase RLK-Pelle-DLSV family [Helianthus annuus]|nr:putative protein kinase RLK-Pelle-DLSV family [Helianthus annuus]KAJ0691287.1 putative protein kinase RLK-Pelle-DLSV family [Helianthus annuus]KAJ0803777.1 putative protein kinase RLK-Pelle-DLSV family [Helianthus annuus]